jgi:PII-like signaling protein
MKGVCLKFYMYELEKHHGILVYEWLLKFGKKHHLPGGCALKALAGYGRKAVMHEEHFFELASNVPVEVSFILQKEEASGFLELLKNEKIDLFYTLSDIEYGKLH